MSFTYPKYVKKYTLGISKEEVSETNIDIASIIRGFMTKIASKFKGMFSGSGYFNHGTDSDATFDDVTDTEENIDSTPDENDITSDSDESDAGGYDYQPVTPDDSGYTYTRGPSSPIVDYLPPSSPIVEYLPPLSTTGATSPIFRYLPPAPTPSYSYELPYAL